ncbi:MAG: DUF262 domain-containing HNH endonuclease family protein [Candidatus Margulisiibacteriota bacterium]
MIDPKPAKVVDLLKSSSRWIVPKYQREYSWGKTEALEFWEDIQSYANSEDDQLFLGTLIFDVSEEKHNIIKIIDGQQRLTTILLLLIALRNRAKEINEREISGQIQSYITFMDDASAESRGNRLIASESIKDIFEEMSKHDWDGRFPAKIGIKPVKRQVNRIKPIFDFFASEVAEYDRTILVKIQKALYKSYVAIIDIQDEAEAFSIFERTNARGMDLEASDLLKNYLFASGVVGVEDIWPQIIENSEGTVLRMLKYFYVSQKGYIAKSQLYKNIRRYSQEIGNEKLLEELNAFSKYFYEIRNANKDGLQAYFESLGYESISTKEDRYQKIYHSLEGLRLFKVSQIYPLVYSAIMSSKSNGETETKTKKLIVFLDVLEKYHFINNAICDRVGNEVEKTYADYCVKFWNTSDFIETANELIALLKRKVAKEDEFVSRFSEISYAQDTIALIMYIFDRIINYKVEPPDRIALYNPNKKITRKNHNIEHFYPQNPESNPLPADVCNNIGNLLCLGFKTNSRLGNMMPKEKIEYLKQHTEEIANKNFVVDFVKRNENSANEWGEKQILNRARVLSKKAYDSIWKF